ncbi:MAG: DUF1579 domain-containing protein [Myxococcota bacterium]
MSDKLTTSRAPGGAHHHLSQLVGTWHGTTQTWFEPGKLADESPWQATIRMAVDDRFALYEYQGSLQGKPLAGLAIIGYHIDRERYEMAWVDSFHTGTEIMYCTGTPAAERFAVLTHYGPPDAQWGWRTEITFGGAEGGAESDSDHLIITAFNITPAGDEGKAVETRYQRQP